MSDLYDRLIHYNEDKEEQIRLTISEFRSLTYLSLRKYYLDFEGVWSPSTQGITMPLELSNSRELFAALIEILSISESKTVLEDHFKDLLDTLYQ